MKEKKGKDATNKLIALVLLIVLFVASFGMGLTGAIRKFINLINYDAKAEIKNSDEFFYDGKLHFSNGAVYECKGSYCGWAYEMVDDISYSLKYYNDDKTNMFDSLINDRFALIVDGNETSSDDPYHRSDNVIVYDTVENKQVAEYNSVKNYSQTLIDNNYIVQDKNGMWGVINFNDGKINEVLKFEYNFIGIFDGDNLGDLEKINNLVVLKDGSWSVIDFTGNAVSNSFTDSIVGYDGNLVVIKNSENKYQIMDNQGFSIGVILDNEVIFTDRGVLVYYDNTNLTVLNTSSGIELFSKSYSSITDVKVEKNGGAATLYVNGNAEYNFQ